MNEDQSPPGQRATSEIVSQTVQAACRLRRNASLVTKQHAGATFADIARFCINQADLAGAIVAAGEVSPLVGVDGPKNGTPRSANRRAIMQLRANV